MGQPPVMEPVQSTPSDEDVRSQRQRVARQSPSPSSAVAEAPVLRVTRDADPPPGCTLCDVRSPRVLVAIRHRTMRRYTREVLEHECGCWVAEESADDELLVAALDRVQPDLLVIDTGQFPDCCAVALDAFPTHRVVVIGPEPGPSYRKSAIERGAGAWIPRDRIGEELERVSRRLLGCDPGHCPRPGSG